MNFSSSDFNLVSMTLRDALLFKQEQSNKSEGLDVDELRKLCVKNKRYCDKVDLARKGTRFYSKYF